MKYAKSLLCLLLALCLLLGMTACSNTTENPPMETTTAAAGSSDQETPKLEDAEDDAQDETEAAVQGTLSLTETVLVDTDDCTIIAKGYQVDSLWGPSIQLYLENKTADTKLMFSIDDASVNGVMCDPFWAEEVPAGKKSNSTVSWSNSTLTDNGIAYLQDLEFSLTVYNAEDYSQDNLVEQICTLSLEGGSGEAVYMPEFSMPEIVLADEQSVQVVAKDFDPEGFFGPTLVLYLVNNTDKTLMFSADDVSVNGYVCDPFWATTVAPGKVAFSEVSWSESTLAENGITTFVDIEFTLRIYDSNDWLADDLVSSIVTVHLGE